MIAQLDFSFKAKAKLFITIIITSRGLSTLNIFSLEVWSFKDDGVIERLHPIIFLVVPTGLWWIK